MLGSSAAALTGLQFVVIALVADTPGLRSADSVGAFGTLTIVHFCLSLFVAAVLSAPLANMIPVIWVLTLIFVGIHNAWDAVTYVAVQLLSKQRE